MPRRTRFDVVFNKRDELWGVRGGGQTQPFGTKQEAVSRAAAEGRSRGNAQVVIRKKDGTILSERTYGSDPRGSKG